MSDAAAAIRTDGLAPNRAVPRRVTVLGSTGSPMARNELRLRLKRVTDTMLFKPMPDHRIAVLVGHARHGIPHEVRSGRPHDRPHVMHDPRITRAQVRRHDPAVLGEARRDHGQACAAPRGTFDRHGLVARPWRSG